MKDVITTFSNTALTKINALNTNKSKYLVGAMLAGFFVGLGIILIFTIGECLHLPILQVQKLLWVSPLELR